MEFRDVNQILRNITTNFRKVEIQGFGKINDISVDKNGDLQISIGRECKTIKGVGKFLNVSTVKKAEAITKGLYSKGILEGVFSFVKLIAVIALIIVIILLALVGFIFLGSQFLP